MLIIKFLFLLLAFSKKKRQQIRRGFQIFSSLRSVGKKLKICQRLACNYCSWLQVTCMLVRHEDKEGARSKGTYLSEIELAR